MTTFRAALSREPHWGLAAKACMDAVGGVRPGDNVGIVYVTRALADALPSILTLLRETSGIAAWAGAAGFGVYAPGAEVHDGPAVALMVGALPEGAARPFTFDDALTEADGAWLGSHPGTVALVHGDPHAGVEERLAALAEASGGYLVGGLAAAPARRDAAPLGGLLIGPPAGVVVGLAQGCSPIGPPHVVTEAVGPIVMALDGTSALDVLRAEAGELISRDLRRAAGYIHAALPLPGSDGNDYAVRGLSGIDPRHGWIEVGAEPGIGDRLLFVRRDAAAARREMRRMLDGLARRIAADGRRPLAGVYISCVGRGPLLFGEADAELDLVESALGPLPLVGFAAAGEICHDRLHTYTGVLAVFVGGPQ